MGTRRLTHKLMQTVFCLVEQALFSRPLLPVMLMGGIWTPSRLANILPVLRVLLVVINFIVVNTLLLSSRSLTLLGAVGFPHWTEVISSRHLTGNHSGQLVSLIVKETSPRHCEVGLENVVTAPIMSNVPSLRLTYIEQFTRPRACKTCTSFFFTSSSGPVIFSITKWRNACA